MKLPKLSIFISSPGDVGSERLIAKRVIERLGGSFRGAIELLVKMWEEEPMRANAHFQEQIPAPAESDIMICILWSRLGTRLPAQFRREDGSDYASGTEWELENALQSWKASGRPDVLVYRKTAPPEFLYTNAEETLNRVRQIEALEGFVAKFFGSVESTFKAAYTTFENLDELESLLETHLRKTIEARLPDSNERHMASTWKAGSPFRGLESFREEHAEIFFGRTRAIGEIREAMLRQHRAGKAFLVIFGMSGCGKSSLMQAGVLPTLTSPGVIEGVDLWCQVVFTGNEFSGHLLEGLARCLHQAIPQIDVTPEEFAKALIDAPQQALLLLKTGLARYTRTHADKVWTRELRSRLIILIDPLESFFSRAEVKPAEREAFFEATNIMARSGFIWIFACMRGDFYHRCVEVPQLVRLKGNDGQYDLLPPSVHEINQIIGNPATAAGLVFEVHPETGEGLDAKLLEAGVQNPEALPLLEFTLDALYQHRAGNLLTFSAYDALGGMEGALAQRARLMIQAQPTAVRRGLPDLFWQFVQMNAPGEATFRTVPRDRFNAPHLSILLDAMLDARLVISDKDNEGRPTVRLVHESLLSHWPELFEWVEKNERHLLVLQRLRATLTYWKSEDEDPSLLLTAGKPLDEAVELLDQRQRHLPEEMLRFIALSRKSAGKTRTSKRTVIALATALLTLVLWIIFVQVRLIWLQTDTAVGEIETALTNLFEEPKSVATLEREGGELIDPLKKMPSWYRYRYHGIGMSASALHKLWEHDLSLRIGLIYAAKGERYRALDLIPDLDSPIRMEGFLPLPPVAPLFVLETNHYLITRGDLYRDVGDFAAAQACYEAVAGAIPDLLWPDHPYLAIVYNRLGYLARLRGQYCDAIGWHEQALNLLSPLDYEAREITRVFMSYPDIENPPKYISVPFPEVSRESYSFSFRDFNLKVLRLPTFPEKINITSSYPSGLTGIYLQDATQLGKMSFLYRDQELLPAHSFTSLIWGQLPTSWETFDLVDDQSTVAWQLGIAILFHYPKSWGDTEEHNQHELMTVELARELAEIAPHFSYQLPLVESLLRRANGQVSQAELLDANDSLQEALEILDNLAISENPRLDRLAGMIHRLDREVSRVIREGNLAQNTIVERSWGLNKASWSKALSAAGWSALLDGNARSSFVSAHFNLALVFQPDLSSAQAGLTFLTLLRGDTRRAMEQADEALVRSPNSIEALIVHAHASLLSGNRGDAEAIYERLPCLSISDGKPAHLEAAKGLRLLAASRRVGDEVIETLKQLEQANCTEWEKSIEANPFAPLPRVSK